MKPGILCIALGILIIPMLSAQTTGNQSQSTLSTSKTTFSTSTSKPITTETPEQACAENNASCEACIKSAKCMYCYTDNSCKLYPTGKILPPSDYCALDKARWGVCWLNFEALIIAVSVVGGVIILTIVSCCVYCCCCRGKNRKKHEIEDEKFEAQRMERKMKQDERRSERKGRLDEIRRKYGLMKDDAPYQRFDA